MKLLFETSSNNPEYDGDCSYMAIDVNRDTATVLLGYMDLVKECKERNSAFMNAEFYFCQFQHFPWIDSEEFEQAIAEIDTQYYNVLPDSFVIPEDYIQRTECDRVCTDGALCWFESVPKHSDVTVWAGYVQRDLLEDIAKDPHHEGESNHEN